MRVSVTGKQLDVGEALKSYVADKLTSAVVKYFDNPIEGQVTISREGSLYRADLNAHVGAGISLQSHGEGGDAYAGFESALDKIDKRLRRYKRRIRKHSESLKTESRSTEGQSYVLASEEGGDEAPEELQPIIIAETRMDIPVVTVGEAVMRMDLGDHPVVMFRNRSNGELNVVYRRDDGNIGWIEPTSARRPEAKSNR